MNSNPEPTRATLCFCGIALLTIFPLYFWADLPVAIYINDWIEEWMKPPVNAISASGDLVLAAFVVALIYFKFFRKDNLAAWRMSFPVAAYLLAGLFVNIIKPMFGRLRPKAYFREDLYGFNPFGGLDYYHTSFPSGHSLTMMAMMTAAAIILPKWRAYFFGGAIIIGLTRIFLRAHYIGDVIAGLVLGYFFALFIFKWMKPKLLTSASSAVSES